MKRVVITGQGTINALGNDVPSTLEAMSKGTLGISELEFPNADDRVEAGPRIGRRQLSHYQARRTNFHDLPARGRTSVRSWRS